MERKNWGEIEGNGVEEDWMIKKKRYWWRLEVTGFGRGGAVRGGERRRM
jgi:hypothetical protein